MINPTYGLQGKTRKSGVHAAELVLTTAFTCPPNQNPKGVIIEAFAPAWAVGIAVTAAGVVTVAFTCWLRWLRHCSQWGRTVDLVELSLEVVLDSRHWDYSNRIRLLVDDEEFACSCFNGSERFVGERDNEIHNCLVLGVPFISILRDEYLCNFGQQLAKDARNWCQRAQRFMSLTFMA